MEEVLTPKSRGRFSGDEVSAAVSLVLNAQWEAMRTGLLEQVEARKAELAAAPLDHAEAVSEARHLRIPGSGGPEGRHAALRLLSRPDEIHPVGEMEEEVAEALDGDGNVVKTRRQVDPREALRRVLNDSGLDAVRTVLELCLTSRGTRMRLKEK